MTITCMWTVKYHANPTYQWNVMVWREKGRDLTQSYDKSPYTNRNVKRAKWQHKQRHKKVRLNSGCGTLILAMRPLWPWPFRCELGSRLYCTLGLWATIVWSIIQINLTSGILWFENIFWQCMHCELDLWDRALDQSYDARFGHGQQLCEISSKSNLLVKYCEVSKSNVQVKVIIT